MSLHLPPTAWAQLCAFIAQHPSCQVTLHVHLGRIVRMDLQETVKVEQGFPSQSVFCAEDVRPFANHLTKQ